METLRLTLDGAKYPHMSVVHDTGLKASIMYMNQPARPCFTPELLRSIQHWQALITRSVQDDVNAGREPRIKYVVGASAHPGFWNTGGDLDLFVRHIRERNRGGLLEYATACIDVAYQTHTGCGVPVTSIALVQGNALGGGFEAALSANVIIAERGVKFGFPEVMFNLFPGMGAYSFLSRRTSQALAERMILSGDLYTAEDLYDLGIVTVLAEPGEGESALAACIKEYEKKSSAVSFLRGIRQTNAVPYTELLEVAKQWVDTAMQLQERDLKTMMRLVRAQTAKGVVSEPQDAPSDARRSVVQFPGGKVTGEC